MPPRNVDFFILNAVILSIDHLSTTDIDADMRNRAGIIAEEDEIALLSALLRNFGILTVLRLRDPRQGLLGRLLEDIFGITRTIEGVWTDCTVNITMTKLRLGDVVEVGEGSGALLNGTSLDPAPNAVIRTRDEIIISRRTIC